MYKKLDAYVNGNGSQQMPREDVLYYFGSTVQFKTCKAFKAFLLAKYPQIKRISVCIAK